MVGMIVGFLIFLPSCFVKEYGDAKSGEERPKVGTEKKRYRIAQTTTDTQIKRAEGMIV